MSDKFCLSVVKNSLELRILLVPVFSSHTSLERNLIEEEEEVQLPKTTYSEAPNFPLFDRVNKGRCLAGFAIGTYNTFPTTRAL